MSVPRIMKHPARACLDVLAGLAAVAVLLLALAASPERRALRN
jgi:hypothetical protein